MSSWYSAITQDMSNLVDCIEHYEQELIQAKKDCAINGYLEKISSELPGITEHRFNQLQEIEAILEHLNIELRKLRSKTFRKYLEAYNRQLSSRDAEKYVDGEQEVVNMAHVINQFSLIRNKYLGIIKGLEQKSFQVGTIGRLRVAGMEDVRL